MAPKQMFASLLVVLAGVALGALMLRAEPRGHDDPHGHDHHDHDDHDDHDDPHGTAPGDHDDERIHLDDVAAEQSNITIDTAGPATLRDRVRLTGIVAANEDRVVRVTPRFAGVVKDARKRLGDRVDAGEVLAVIQSNESLQPYDVRSHIAGTVMQRRVTAGEFVDAGEAIYVVADLGTVWVDLTVHRQDLAAIRIGQPVVIDGGEGVPVAESIVAYLSPVSSAHSQTVLARVELPNPAGHWRPGLFVAAEAIAGEVRVPVAVQTSALQRYADRDVVFVRVGDRFEMRPVRLGRRDGTRVEVVSGLTPGERYAAENSFVLKADLGKAGLEHDH